jgi:hypothetical protein
VHYDSCPLGHSKPETTARYAHVATGMIAAVESPLDLLAQEDKKAKKRRKDQPDQPPA